jgi:hypothetical protein
VETTPQEVKPARLTLPDRIVTLDALDGKLGGVTEIYVQRKAVITPAAKDVIHERGIRLSRVHATSGDSQQPGTAITVGVAACAVEPVAAGQIRRAPGGPVEFLASVGLEEVVREMSEQIVLGVAKGVLFTTELAAALCLANRRRGVRAIAGKDATEVLQAASSVGGNLLVIRPDGISTWQQVEMVRAFASYGPPQCPDAYRQALG